MLSILYPLNALLMIAFPIMLGVWLQRRWNLSWRLFGIGAATFILSQVVHLPLLWGLTALFTNNVLPNPSVEWKLIFNATVLGLAAGVCEEVARYLVYRFWLKTERSWSQALMFGAGHGGIEAMLVGALALLAFVQLYALQTTDLSTLPLSAEQLATLTQQVAEYWNAPWYMALLGFIERLSALCHHIAWAVIVLQAFRRNNPLWLMLAIGWHALVDGVAVYSVQTWGTLPTEALIGVSALLALFTIYALRSPDLPLESAPAGDSPTPPTPMPLVAKVTSDKIDDSRFSS